MAFGAIDDAVPRPPCGCVRGGASGRCQKQGGCAPDGAWVSYYQALASLFGTLRVVERRYDGCESDENLPGAAQSVDGSGGVGCGLLCFGSVGGVRDCVEESGVSVRRVLQAVQNGIEPSGQGGVDGLVSSRHDRGSEGSTSCDSEVGKCGDTDGVQNVMARVDGSVDLGLSEEQGGAGVVENNSGFGLSERTLLNRSRRVKAKMRKQRKKSRQGLAFQSDDWNADKERVRSGGAVKSSFVPVNPRGYFSSCADDVRQKLVETRARRLTVENELRVKEMELKMSTMELQKSSRLHERQFENERMRVEIQARKNMEQMPGGMVETVVSSGSVSPNSSISLAAENKLRKDLADANAKLEKMSGSSIGGGVMTPTERELRLANFELEFIRLEEKVFRDDTFTDEDYKLSLQALRDSYADVLLSDEKRIAREAVRKVMDVLSSKIDDEAIDKIAAMGYIDADTIVY